MSEDKKANMNVKISRELRIRFKSQVAAEESNMSEITEVLVRLWMDMSKEQKKQLLLKYTN